MHITSHPTATFGATVTGLRLADLDDAGFAALHAAWLQHALLIFPGQHLSNAQQITFAKRFGPIERMGGGDIVAISNVKADGTVRQHTPAEWDDMMKVIVGNMAWHADSTYMPVMAQGAVFSAEVVPPTGGRTAFADMRAAWDALDDATRALVEQRSAHHSLKYSQSKLGHVQAEGSAYNGYGMDTTATPLRPLVKVHPETGRKSLLIGRHAHAIPRRPGRLGLPGAAPGRAPMGRRRRRGVGQPLPAAPRRALGPAAAAGDVAQPPGRQPGHRIGHAGLSTTAP